MMSVEEQTIANILSCLANKRINSMVFSSDCIEHMPSNALNIMVTQKIITPSQTATTTICPGCENACVMPIERLSPTDKKCFILCDSRPDICYIPIDHATLKQYKISHQSLGKFIANDMELRYVGNVIAEGAGLEIGMVRGKRYSQMCCIMNHQRDIMLQVGHEYQPLASCFLFHNGRFRIDHKSVQSMADCTFSADHRYTPNTAKREARKLETKEKYRQWNKMYLSLKKQHQDKSKNWIATQIQKSQIGRNNAVDTIRKQMVGHHE